MSKYNGWTNYETWNAALWLDSDEGSQSMCAEMAQECFDDAEACHSFTRLENAECALAEAIRDIFEDDADLPQTGWLADAVNAYLGEVNWHEIAVHYLCDIEQEHEELSRE